MEKIVNFLKEVRQELLKVSWPTFRDFVNSTIVVLIIVALFAAYLGLVDLGVAQIAKTLIFKQ